MLRDVVGDGRLPRVLGAMLAFSVVEYGAWFAVLVYAYDVGGAGLAGLVGVVQLVPAAVLAPALGSLGDRLPRGVALCGAYAVEAGFLAATALLLLRGAPVGAVVLASAFATVTVSVARPIHYAALPSLSPTARSLVSANSLSGVFDAVGVFVGPVVAGVLVQADGAWLALGAGAAAMAVAALLTIRLGLPAAAADGGGGAVREAVEGVRQVGRDRGALALLLLLGVSYVVVGALEILAVSFSDQVLQAGSSAAGLLVGADGLGALAGAALAGAVAVRARLATPVALALVLAAVPLVAMAGVASVIVAALLISVLGIGQAMSAVTGRTLLQRGVDDAVLARVFAVQEGVMLCGLAAGAALAPVLVGWRGAAGAFVPLGTGLLLVALLAWRPMLALDRRAVFRPEVLAALLRVGFLAAMAPPSLERVAQASRWTDVAAGAAVVTQGDRGDAFYVVADGRLCVDVDGVRRDHEIVAGDGFGEVALLHGIPRTATVTALEPCRLLSVGRADFLAAVTGSPDGQVIASEVARAHLHRDAGGD